MLPAEVQRHRFTVEEYHGMGETSLLSTAAAAVGASGPALGARRASCSMKGAPRRPGLFVRAPLFPGWG